MCALALALAALTSACPAPAAAPPAPVEARRLSQPELARIRGAGGFVAKRGRDGVVRLVQDSNMRDMTLVSPAPTQIPDNWFAQTGASLLAIGLSRP